MNAVMNNFSPALDVQNGPMLVAHRGGSKEWPENSLTAFRNVVREPIDMLEIDVHQTRDGRSVVMHDPTLDRTTTGMGPIRSFSAAEIGRFFLTGSVREPIPTLSDVLELLSGTRLQLRIDVKSDPAGASYEGLEEELLDQVSRYGMFDRTTVISFDRQVLDNMRKLSGKIPLGKNIGLKDIMRAGGMSQVLSELKDRGIDELSSHFRLLDEETVANAKAAGLGVAVWTVNDSDDLRYWLCSDVDSVTTDRPVEAVRMRQELYPDIYGNVFPLKGAAYRKG